MPSTPNTPINLLDSPPSSPDIICTGSTPALPPGSTPGTAIRLPSTPPTPTPQPAKPVSILTLALPEAAVSSASSAPFLHKPSNVQQGKGKGKATASPGKPLTAEQRRKEQNRVAQAKHRANKKKQQEEKGKDQSK